jgi:hypothetical protein
MNLKYFLPDWEDRLDPNFDFIRDKYSKNHKKNPYENDIYAHQIYEKPPYDGVLMSLSVFQSKISLTNRGNSFKIRNKNNIKNYLKMTKNSSLKVMGDCGAFGYVKEQRPPLPFYNIKNVSNIYEKLEFDYGVSIDHLAVDYVMVKDKKTGKKKKKDLSKREKNRRVKLTLRNAKKFLKLHKKQHYNFIPIGVAQGYDTETYKNSVRELIEMGYEYIAIGGLVQYTSEKIIKILKEIQPHTGNTKIHLFGVLRPGYLNKFKKLGVTSFDSASYLRKAWLRSGQNYLASDGKWYAAIRVPHATNPRILKKADLNGFTKTKIKKMEKKALKTLMEYDKGKISVEDTLDTILKYDNLLLRYTNDGKNLKTKYKRTLENRPWDSCNCKVCKELGIQVLIFRGCNRNKRRGFHNIWTFRERFKKNKFS